MDIRTTQNWLNRQVSKYFYNQISARALADRILAKAEEAIRTQSPGEVVNMLQGEYRHYVEQHEKEIMEDVCKG